MPTAHVTTTKKGNEEIVFCTCGYTVARMFEMPLEHGKRSDNLYEHIKAEVEDKLKREKIMEATKSKMLNRENGELKAKLEELEAQRKNLQDKLIAESAKIVRLESNIRKLNAINEHMQELINELERKIELYDKARS